MNSGNVSAYGPGLIHGTVNKPAVFTVNTKDAGEGMSHLSKCSFTLPTTEEDLHLKESKGQLSFRLSAGGLSLAIEGPSKADISCVDNQDGTCTVSYLPVLPGDYSILVKYNDKHIPGSPFSARITGKTFQPHVSGFRFQISEPETRLLPSRLNTDGESAVVRLGL